MTDDPIPDEPAETVVYEPTPDITPGEVVETYAGDPAVPAVIPGVDPDELEAAVQAVSGMSPTGGTRRAVEHIRNALTPTPGDTP